MLVVSDTTPLNYLVLIGLVEVLPAMYGTVIVPEQVIAELCAAKTPDLVRSWAQAPPQWIEVRAAVASEFPSLDAGESAAISLALQLRSRLLADESAARRIAGELGVSTIGTIGIIAEAHLKKLLNFDDAVNRLRTTSFRVHERLIGELRSRIGAERDT